MLITAFFLDVFYDFRQYADNATYTVSEDGTASLVNGTDYYENDASGTFALNPASTLEDGNKYRARAQNDAGNEWTRYDIKGLMSGTYNVTFRAGVRSATDLYFYVGTGNALSTTPQVIFDAAAGYMGGRLKEMKPKSISLSGNISYSFTEKLTPNSFDLVKVFAWEDLNGMIPVADASSKEAEVEYISEYLGDGFTR